MAMWTPVCASAAWFTIRLPTFVMHVDPVSCRAKLAEGSPRYIRCWLSVFLRRPAISSGMAGGSLFIHCSIQ